MKIYVASSWRNPYQPQIVQLLRGHKYDVYDFRNPTEGDKGFGWREIDEDWKNWSPEKFRRALLDPIAVKGFRSDFDAMKAADVCVLVMPCGRSAHIEAGYFVGAGKPLYILLADGEPELMYAMANGLCVNTSELIECLATAKFAITRSMLTRQ